MTVFIGQEAEQAMAWYRSAPVFVIDCMTRCAEHCMYVHVREAQAWSCFP